MQRVSARTLVLMLLLLGYILAHQHITFTEEAKAEAIWLFEEQDAPEEANVP